MENARPAKRPSGWISAQRRKAADAVAELLAAGGPAPATDRFADLFIVTPTGSTDLAAAVQRALRDAWTLSAARTPPRRSVLARNALGGTRLVRAVGAGWSLVARTDGPAFLLLDVTADAAVDIHGEDLLCGLLNALTAAANRSPH